MRGCDMNNPELTLIDQHGETEKIQRIIFLPKMKEFISLSFNKLDVLDEIIHAGIIVSHKAQQTL